MERVKAFPANMDGEARVLILGSMPGAESLRRQEYYAFRHNAFWPIMGEIFGFSRELPYAERLQCLKRRRIALWDVLQSCERPGSLDTAIAHPEPNDIPGLLRDCPDLRLILCNGGAAGRYLKRFFPALPVPVKVLPSTSPAAAAVSYEAKLRAYREALDILNN